MRLSQTLVAAAIAGALLAGIVTSADLAPAPVSFVDNTARAGLDFVLRNHATPEKHQVETMPAGVAVLDFDNDGFEDVYFINGASVPDLKKSDPADWNRLYRNRGNGTFEDVTRRSKTAGAGYSMGVAAADYDNDGRTDLFVAGVNENILYRNQGDGKFLDVTRAAGLGVKQDAAKPWSIAAGWLDYDNDGRLDLLVVNYCVWNPDKEPFCGDPRPGRRTYCHPRHYAGLPNQLYRNNGDGTFSDVSQSTGIANHIGKGMGVAFADYDDDGRTDIFIANDTVRNFLFHNEGKTFTEVGLRAGIAFNADGRALSSMGVDFRDIDNDGKPDLFITALTNETFTLHRNQGGGLFRDITYASGIASLTLPWGGWGTGIYDLNNDGRKDIFTANSDVMDNAELFSSRASKQPNQVYLNAATGRFLESPKGSSDWRKPRAHRGSAFADFDRDGRIDVVVTSLNEPVELLRNTSERQHWIAFALRGTRSNRDAIGARLKVTTAPGASQWNHVTTSVGYASSSSKHVHFGLGSEARASRVEIRWPSGQVQVLENVAADRLVPVIEPE